ncbi:hypothetical protein AAG570_001413 [Ranatra chinensis]|uniref:CCAAT-binding factor domain-containing protein n=1 Tax=Ranatra chinensis TaxID=642074 RepID=A0ABD0YQK8_9HEMI
MVVSIQNSPVHNLNALNSLVGLVKVGKKRQCMEAMKVASQVFVEDLLRPDLKLRTLDRQPLKQLDELCGGDAIIRRKRLAAWAFEEKLKQLYNQFVMALATVSKDTLEVNREKSIATMSYLLESNPELEGVLLQNIINKLGDLSQKVVSKVIYCLTQLLRKHPNMKKVVMDETHKLLVRTNVGVRAQYYAICFLSQFVFTDKDRDVARHLITIYFGFFKTSIKMGEVNSRMMGALLMGVKRAYPFAKLTLQSSGGEENTKQLREHIDTLYKLVHVSKFNIALHTLALLHQVSSVTEDRLGESTHHALLINLLFKSLHGDENLDRVKAMIKRLLQICLNLPVPLTCGLLYMVSQLIKRRRSLACFETTAVPVLPSFLTEIKQEDDTDNLKNDYEDDGEEKYVDADTLQQCGGGTARGWYHCETVTNRQPRWANRLCYDGQARNPLFANADKTAYFELLSLANHFHPTVSLFANKILNHEIITYSGDPLTDFTLIRFLERFVFKNPKKTMMVKGMTNEQKGPDPKLAMRKYYQPEGAKSMPVTSKQYLSLAEKTVPVDELFLYK